MTGKYYLKLENRKVAYDLELDTEITVVRGDSSSGKSEFARLLQRTIRNREWGCFTSEYSTNFKNVVVTKDFSLSGTLGALEIEEALIVIDEGNPVMKAEILGKMIKENKINSYLLLITRKDFCDLSDFAYSICHFVREENFAYSEKSFTRNVLKKLL